MQCLGQDNQSAKQSAVRRKRETLTGDATIRYFDYLDGFDHFDGLLANLFTGESLLQHHEAGWHVHAQVQIHQAWFVAAIGHWQRRGSDVPQQCCSELFAECVPSLCCPCCLQRSAPARSAALQQLILLTHLAWWTET
jgi:hypothetical protein